MAESKFLIDIKNQVEYYLSDTNLKTDEFFRNEILSSDEGYLNLEHLLKCNKIKKLSATRDSIVEALKTSEKLELNPDSSGVRRKNNAPLPEPAPSKRLKTERNSENHKAHEINHGNDHNENQAEEHKQEEKKEDKFANYEPLVLRLNVEGSDKVDWRDVRRKIETQFHIEIFYMTRSVSPGCIVLSKNAIDAALLETLTSESGIAAEGNIVYKLGHPSEEEIKTFWTQNGPHYNIRIESLKSGVKAVNDPKKKKDRKGRSDVVIFGKEKYYDISKLKDIFKNLLNKTQNGAKIQEPGHTMLLELIHHHDKFKEKGKDISHFTADVHPEHVESRCFFIVRQDGSKEDFSAMKCIKNLQK